MNQEPARFKWRAFTSVLITLCFIVLVLSGVMLFASPPGRIANWTNWTLLGLSKREWTSLHIGFSAVFLTVSVAHIVFNVRPLLSYFKDRLTRRVGFRWEWAAAIALGGLVYGGTRAGLPPFSTLLAFNEQVKQSWEEPAERAPIPHAELLTLAELVERAGVDLATAKRRLEAHGIVGVDPGVVTEELARENGRSAQQIYQLMVSGPAPGPAGHGYGGEGRGGGGAGRGGAGGWTWTQDPHRVLCRRGNRAAGGFGAARAERFSGCAEPHAPRDRRAERLRTPLRTAGSHPRPIAAGARLPRHPCPAVTFWAEPALLLQTENGYEHSN